MNARPCSLGLLVFAIGPLLLVGFVIVAVALAIKVARKYRTIVGKLIAGAGGAMVVLLIPTWDIFVGRIEYHRLCAKESGMRIHTRAAPQAEYRNTPLPESPLAYNRTPLGKLYPWDVIEVDDLRGPGKIKFSREMIRDASTGEVLGTLTMYFWGGGWFENAFSTAGAGGGYCGRQDGDFPDLLKQVLVISR